MLHIRAVQKHLDLSSKPSNARVESIFCATHFVHVFLLVCYISLNIPSDVLLSKTNLISWPIQRLVSRNYVGHKITPRHAIFFNHEFTLHHVFTVRSYLLPKSGITSFPRSWYKNYKSFFPCLPDYLFLVHIYVLIYKFCMWK